MSAREYAPGTVAVATVQGAPGVRVFRRDRDWAYVPDPGRGVTYSCASDHENLVTDVRPLVVLDPGNWVLDGGTVSSIRDSALGLPHAAHFLLHQIADQIEAQTKPPKPVEPTGLGAVVRDENNELWTRVADNDAPWRFMHYRRNWSAINVADVLSEGVSA